LELHRGVLNELTMQVQARAGTRRTCIFHQAGSGNCCYLREKDVVAMAVGFGP